MAPATPKSASAKKTPKPKRTPKASPKARQKPSRNVSGDNSLTPGPTQNVNNINNKTTNQSRDILHPVSPLQDDVINDVIIEDANSDMDDIDGSASQVGGDTRKAQVSGPSRVTVRGDLGDIGRTRRGIAGVAGHRGERNHDNINMNDDPTSGSTNNIFGYQSTNLLDERELKAQFEIFIYTYKTDAKAALETRQWDFDVFDSSDNLINSPPYYLQQLRRLIESGALNETAGFESSSDSTNVDIRNFPIDLTHLKKANISLCLSALHFPADSLVFMDEVLSDIASKEYADVGLEQFFVKTSLFHHPTVRGMRDLNPSDVESLVAVRGIVIRCSSVIPDMRTATFRCTNRLEVNQQAVMCGHEETVQLCNGEIDEPLECIKCRGKYSFEISHSRCTFGNKQLIKLQESPENIPEGETPQTTICYAYDDLVDIAKPGDFIEVTGIYRAMGVRVIPKQRALKAIYRTIIDANHINKSHLNKFVLGERELNAEGGGVKDAEQLVANEGFGTGYQVGTSNDAAGINKDFSKAMVEKFEALGRDPNIYQKLIKSLAPNIWEAEDVKKGLLCQLFGGCAKSLGGRGSHRSDIHVLLCGDPSTAKSQLLQYVHNIAPRGVYTCGRGSSAVGLTASVSRDPETKEFVLESGAIVLSDKGVCCIDEFDKMDDSARIILHEVMEQQTVSIAKAGIVCSLNARTAILASANPIQSRYDINRSVVENINLLPTLLSRFDLIYLMLDTPNESLDRALAQHLCNLYSDTRHKTVVDVPLNKETFSQYISYARRACQPVIAPEAATLLVETYIRLRQKGCDGIGRALTATPRQLESLIRLSEALARMQLSPSVTVAHVTEAARLIQVATYSALVDPTTGRLDFNQINAGVSAGSKVRRDILEKAILSVLSQASQGGMEKETMAEKIDAVLRSENRPPLEPSKRELDVLLRELEEIGTLGRLHGSKYILQVRDL